MDIISLQEGVRKNSETGFYNLFTPTFIYNSAIELQQYTVTKEDEMRIDLVFTNMYLIEMSMMIYYYKDLDVIMFINNITNPLNVKEGMILDYPLISELENFRYSQPDTIIDNSITKQLGIQNLPNKKTRKDSSRQSYIENDYSLSPVVLDTPREPVRIENNRFSIGGL